MRRDTKMLTSHHHKTLNQDSCRESALSIARSMSDIIALRENRRYRSLCVACCALADADSRQGRAGVRYLYRRGLKVSRRKLRAGHRHRGDRAISARRAGEDNAHAICLTRQDPLRACVITKNGADRWVSNLPPERSQRLTPPRRVQQSPALIKSDPMRIKP